VVCSLYLPFPPAPPHGPAPPPRPRNPKTVQSRCRIPVPQCRDRRSRSRPQWRCPRCQCPQSCPVKLSYFFSRPSHHININERYFPRRTHHAATSRTLNSINASRPKPKLRVYEPSNILINRLYSTPHENSIIVCTRFIQPKI